MEENTQPKRSLNIYKMLFFLLLFVVILAVAIVAGFYLGKKYDPFSSKTSETKVEAKVDKKEGASMDNSTISTVPSTEIAALTDRNVITPSENTVSFARTNTNAVIIKYHDQIFDDTSPFTMEPVKNVNASDYTWYGLVNTPDNVKPKEFMYDEVFGLKSNSKVFVFIMRWGDSKTNGPIKYYVYKYDSQMTQPLTLLKTFVPSDNEPAVPKMLTLDDKYVAFSMYGCWNCGGGTPETLLMRLSDGKTQKIGKTSYFNWKTDGKYEYKEYQSKPCAEPGPGECFVEPEKLPMKEGSFPE
jgi:hypothetical protein